MSGLEITDSGVFTRSGALDLTIQHIQKNKDIHIVCFSQNALSMQGKLMNKTAIPREQITLCQIVIPKETEAIND